MGNKKNLLTLYAYLLGGVILAIELAFLAWTGYSKSVGDDTIVEKTFWSSTQGAPESRRILNASNGKLIYRFYNEYKQLNEFIVFFYHCADTKSGKVFIDLENEEGNSIYTYSFEPLYMKEDTFCLTAHPENLLEESKYYKIVIRAENMNDDDYLEIGTSTYTQNRNIFIAEEEEVLFTKLDYTFHDKAFVRDIIGKWIKLFLLMDFAGIVLFLFMIKKRRTAVMALLTAVGCVVIYKGVNYVLWANQWHEKYKLISHALGGIDGKVYTNSLEAFETAYKDGHRVFEVDFSTTSDGHIILKHDWENAHGLPEFENGYIPTLEEFMDAKIWNQYTAMSLESLFTVMAEYKDIYIVTDSKAGKYMEVVNDFEYMEEILQNFSDKEQKHIREHLVIQIYNNDMYTAVESVGHYDNYIYTLYQKGINTLDDTVEFCKKNDITVVTMPYNWWTEEINGNLHENGLKVYLHTINDENEVRSYIKNGVDGIYTDFVLP